MGRGPEERIYKKLISKYLTFNAYGRGVTPDTMMVGKLLSAYKLHGVNHPETNQIRNQLNEELKIQERQLNDLKKETKLYPSLVQDYLYNIKHKGEKKGRHQVPADYFGEIEKDKEKLDI